jgi:hypothetical protein
MDLKINDIVSLSLVFVLIFILHSCATKSDIIIDYCEMLALDQSYISSDRSDEEKFQSDRKARKAIFKENFNKIIEYSKINGFPEMGSLQTSGLDSCRNWAVMITLFHVGQSQPHLFFEKETKQLLEKEIEEGRLKSGSLFPPLREGFRNHEFCIQERQDIYSALKAWQIEIDDLPQIQFIDCSNFTDIKSN